MRHALDEGVEPVFHKSDREHHEQYERKKDDPPFAPVIGFKDGAPRYVPSPLGQGMAFDGKLYFDAGIHADFRYKSTTKDYRERYTIAAWVNAAQENSGTIVAKVSDAPAEVEKNLPRATGYGVYFANGRINFNLIFRWGEDALRVETAEPVSINAWHHVAVVFDGLKQNEERIEIYIDGQARKLNYIQRSSYLLFGGSKDTLKIGAGGGPQFRFNGALDEVRLYSRTLNAEEIAALACADSLVQIAAFPPARRTVAQAFKLDRAFIAAAAPPALQQAQSRLTELRAARQKFADDVPTLMVMQEMPEPRPTFLLKRGAYDAPGEAVTRGVPAALPPLSSDAPNNRLGLARWLVGRDHPLTSRVAVNRLWQMFFGAGLVRTAEDFGAQGEQPTHPELLDWLAVEFREGDKETRRPGDKEMPDAGRQTPDAAWDVKALLKLIVTSATYRQSSAVNSVTNPQSAIRNPQSIDPDNRLLARGPRYRLSAEMIRDQALAVSGLLVEKTGGPSVKPYQPDGLYKDMAFSGLTGYAPDKGEGLWRRSLYTFWKRTVLSPTMAVFDASAREFCTVREVRTNTPLQSLNLMNDVTYVEAARMLAERALKECASTLPEERLAWAFRAVTARHPNDRERQTLLRAFNKQLAYFTANAKEANALLAVGARLNDAQLNQTELAAYAMTASLILNLDEVITKQ